MAYGTNTNIPTGWLLCNGDEYVQTGTYTNLYSLIGSNYGSATAGYFKIPDMRKSTTATNSTIFVSYIIKT
jgi:microcystin-dependent protein